MSTAAEIEAAIRQLPESEMKVVAKWLQDYLLQQTAQAAPPAIQASNKWRGRGKLPVGSNTDEYLQLTRDANGS